MKTKQDISIALESVFNDLNTLLKEVDNKTFTQSIKNKWNISQNIEHLSISNNITALSLATPKFLLRQSFKTNNRVSWNYDEVVWRYQLQLNEGAKANFAFQPKISLFPLRSVVDTIWKNSCSNLLKSLESWTEEELDTYLIPHPIIGKITVRELLFFTIYHVGHHLKSIQQLV